MKNFNKDNRPGTSMRGSRFPSKDKEQEQEVPSNEQVVEGQPMPLNKYIAHCGVCSRRKAVDLIKDGQAKVNDIVILNPGHRVSASDTVLLEDKLIEIEQKKVYLLLNKPKNCITTVSDELGRLTVMDVVKPKIKERIFPVGRLDRMTTGLLVLTNDGDLAMKLSHPSHEISKVYHVTLDKAVSEEDLEQIRQGLHLEDGQAVVDVVRHIDKHGPEEVSIEIHIGRNRIVRRIFEHLGYIVVKLDRIYYANLNKKNLPRGWFRHLTEQEVIMLKHFM